MCGKRRASPGRRSVKPCCPADRASYRCAQRGVWFRRATTETPAADCRAPGEAAPRTGARRISDGSFGLDLHSSLRGQFVLLRAKNRNFEIKATDIVVAVLPDLLPSWALARRRTVERRPRIKDSASATSTRKGRPHASETGAQGAADTARVRPPGGRRGDDAPGGRGVASLRCARGGVLRVGDRARDFVLPNADERLVDSRALLARGPLIVSFYRGRS
jgi:hypothetical protein